MVNALVLLACKGCSAECFCWRRSDDVQGWRQFEGHIPADERSDLVAAYHKRLTSADTAVRGAAVSVAFSYIQILAAVLAQLHLRKLVSANRLFNITRWYSTLWHRAEADR